MSNNQNDDSWILVVAACVVGAIAYCVWQFANFFGLDMASAGSVLLRPVILTVLFFLAWKFGDEIEFLSLGNVWPVFFAFFWICWWPAVDFWAAKQITSVYMYDQVGVIWWGAWYTKWGVLVGIIAAGYLIKKILQDR